MKRYEECVWGELEDFLEELNEDSNCKNITYVEIGDGSYLVTWKEI